MTRSVPIACERLLEGPLIFHQRHYYNSWTSLHAIHRYGLATCFPDGKEELSYREISALSGLAEPHVQRLLRHAMTFHIFQERKKGIVSHTAASKMLAENSNLRQWIGMVAEEFWPSATRVIGFLPGWYCFKLMSKAYGCIDSVAGLLGAESYGSDGSPSILASARLAHGR